MKLKHLLVAATVALCVHAAPVMAQDAAIDAMQEYMMFSEHESASSCPSRSIRPCSRPRSSAEPSAPEN